MMDTSDGLADALYKIAQASNVEIDVDEKLIPQDPDLKEVAKICGGNPLDWALFGGEDYTLVACVDEDTANQLDNKNIPIRKIGKVISDYKNGLVKIKCENQELLIDEKVLVDKAFNHFN